MCAASLGNWTLLRDLLYGLGGSRGLRTSEMRICFRYSLYGFREVHVCGKPRGCVPVYKFSLRFPERAVKPILLIRANVCDVTRTVLRIKSDSRRKEKFDI
jgi:hypothetical protein